MAHQALVLKGFQTKTLLGKGAYGQVWQATTPEGRSVAVKIFHETVGSERAKEEADALAAFDSPNILKLEKFFVEPSNCAFLVTEYMSGGDLLKLMQERGCKPLEEDEMRRYFRQLVFAIDHMHRRGWVHRDVKCENILLSADQEKIILADMGFATQWHPDKLLFEPLGSLHYSAPEICAGESYRGPEVDVWSMGVVLYALGTGRLPYGGQSEQEIADRIIAGACPTPRNVSPALRSLLQMLLNPLPEKRATLDAVKLHPWLMGAPKPQVLPRALTGDKPLAPKPAHIVQDAGRERRGSVIITRPTAPMPAPPMTARPRGNSVVEFDAGVLALRQRLEVQQLESELEKTGNTGAGNFEIGPSLAGVDTKESGFMARLSRFTKSGVKRFSLSRLHGDKKEVPAAAQKP